MGQGPGCFRRLREQGGQGRSEEVKCKLKPGNSGEEKRIQAEETSSEGPHDMNKPYMLVSQT